MPTKSQLDPKLATLLRSLRSSVRQYIVWDSLLALGVVVLAGFWIGLALDFLPVQLGGTEMPRSARGALLIIVGLLCLGIVFRLLLGRLRRALPDDSLALLVERHHPDFGGRLVTAVQLSQPDRQGDAHAEEMLEVVHREAASLVDRVEPKRVFRWQPLIRKGLLVAPLAVAVAVLGVLSPDTFVQAASRLALWSDDPWPRRADLEMIGVELPLVVAAEGADPVTELVSFEDRQMRLPRGSSGTLRIRARADDAVVPNVCTVYYRSDDGTRGQANMRRIGRVVDGYQSFILDGSPLAGLSDSLTLSIRGLDDRLDDYRIEAVEPPAIANLRIQMKYPEYLRQSAGTDPDLETDYRAGLRIREGSEVTLIASGSQPLGEVDVDLRDEAGAATDVAIRYSEDRTEAELRLDNVTSPTIIRMVPRDGRGISAQAPYRYYLGVVLDEPPNLSVRLSGIGSAITPMARIPVATQASDDYGIERLEITVVAAGDGEPEPNAESTGSADTGAPGGDEQTVLTADTAAKSGPRPAEASRQLGLDREGKAKTVLDLRDLVADGSLPAIQAGQAVHLYGEASDAYDLNHRPPTRSEVFRLEVVTPEQLLALLERRELAFRARLEQTIDETRGLRDSLDVLRRRWAEETATADLSDATNGDAEQPQTVADEDQPQAAGDSEGRGERAVDTRELNAEGNDSELTRQLQIRQLRIQQAALQADKTSEELSGIVASLGDLLEEMVNNRVDSVDRRERIGDGVRDPLQSVIDGPLDRLRQQLVDVRQSLEKPRIATEKTAEAVRIAEQVLLDLTAVLEKMLDLESYNEILDLFRSLIDDQEKLLEETKQRQKRSVLDLFD